MWINKYVLTVYVIVSLVITSYSIHYTKLYDIELSSYYKHRSKRGFSWQVTGTFTKNINEIEDLGELTSLSNEDSKPGNWRSAFMDVTTYMRPGYEAGAFFLIPTDGIFKTQEDLDAHVFTKEDGSTVAIQPNVV